MARKRPQLPLPGIKPGVGPIDIEIPTMDWEQIGGDIDPGAYGGIIATADGRAIELIKIQPVREYVGDEAKDVGFPFWTRVAHFDADDLALDSRDVRSALDSIGMDLETLEADYTPAQRAMVIAEALLGYGRGDEGESGWSKDIGIPDKVKWWSGKIAGAEYLSDEDQAFRDDVLGHDEIRQALEEEAERLADISAAEAWSTAGDQLVSDMEADGYDPESIVVIGEFGDGVAVNGDVLVDQGWEKALGLKHEPHPQLWSDVGVRGLEGWLEKSGFELTKFGGRVPTEEGYAYGEHVVDAVAKRLDVSRDDVESVAKSVDWFQDEIPWGTSGDTQTWAKRRAGAEPETGTEEAPNGSLLFTREARRSGRIGGGETVVRGSYEAMKLPSGEWRLTWRAHFIGVFPTEDEAMAAATQHDQTREIHRNVYWRDIPHGSRVELVGKPGSQSYVATLPDGTRASVYWGESDSTEAQRSLDGRVRRDQRPPSTHRRRR
jgi:hypothetical protein